MCFLMKSFMEKPISHLVNFKEMKYSNYLASYGQTEKNTID